MARYGMQPYKPPSKRGAPPATIWLQNKLAEGGLYRLTYALLLGVLSPFILFGLAATLGAVWSEETLRSSSSSIYPDWVPRTRGVLAAAVPFVMIGILVFIIGVILSVLVELPVRCIISGPRWVINGRKLDLKPWLFR